MITGRRVSLAASIRRLASKPSIPARCASHQHQIRLQCTIRLKRSFAGVGLTHDDETWRELDYAVREVTEQGPSSTISTPNRRSRFQHVGRHQHRIGDLNPKGCRYHYAGVADPPPW